MLALTLKFIDSYIAKVDLFESYKITKFEWFLSPHGDV